MLRRRNLWIRNTGCNPNLYDASEEELTDVADFGISRRRKVWNLCCLKCTAGVTLRTPILWQDESVPAGIDLQIQDKKLLKKSVPPSQRLWFCVVSSLLPKLSALFDSCHGSCNYQDRLVYVGVIHHIALVIVHFIV